MKERLLSLRKKCQGRKDQDQVRKVGGLENKTRSIDIRLEG